MLYCVVVLVVWKDRSAIIIIKLDTEDEGTVWSFETLGTIYLMTQYNSQEDLNLQQHHCENLKYDIEVDDRRPSMNVCISQRLFNVFSSPILCLVVSIYVRVESASVWKLTSEPGSSRHVMKWEASDGVTSDHANVTVVLTCNAL